MSLALGALVATTLASTATATEDFSFDRIGGGDRYATAALVAAAHDGGDTAILVNGSAENYVDALTANYLAGELNAPVLLTKHDATPSAILQQLGDDAITDVVVVGGPVAVSEQQISGLVGRGYDVQRVAGMNRFETNAAVIEAAGPADDGIGLVATGYDFADSLAGGPLVYQGHPLALTRVDRMDAVVVDALRESGVNSVYVLGGPVAVSDDVLAQLESAGISVLKRLSGEDRTSTSVAIAEELVAEHDFSAEGVNVASGAHTSYGADALSGGPLTGQMNQPLLITNSSGGSSVSLDAFLSENCSTLAAGLIFGGEQAISETTKARMEAAAQSCDGEDVTDPVMEDAVASVDGDSVVASVLATDDVAVDAVNATLLDEQGVAVSIGAAAGSGNTYSVTFTNVDDGTYTVRFTATDTSGNTAQATTSAVVVADDDVMAPTLSGLAATVEGDTVNASATVVDDVAVQGVEAALLDEQGSEVSTREATASGDVFSVSFQSVDDGTYTVRFTATDTSGNSAHATTETVEVADDDVTPPTLSNPEATAENDSVKALVNVTDDVEIQSVAVDLLDEQEEVVATLPAEGSESVQATFTNVDDGTYTVLFTATDTSGNTAEATSAPVVVEADVTAPVLSEATATVEGDEIQASITATDEEGIESVTAELRNAQGATLDTRPAAKSGDTYSAVFSNVADGTYTVRFTATDIWDNVSQDDTDALVVDTTLVIGEPYTGDDGLTVTLNSVTVTEKPGSYEYRINYTLLNETDVAIDEGSWKAYDRDGGEALAQYGFFGRLFPAESLTRTYTFEEVKSVQFDVVAYHSEQFFSDYPPSDALVFRVPEAQ